MATATQSRKTTSNTPPVRSPEDMAAELARAYPADAVEVLDSMALDDAARVVEAMPLIASIRIFNQPGLDKPARLIEKLSHDRGAALVAGLLADRRADIFRELPEKLHSHLFSHLDEQTQRQLKQLLSYPHDSAGGIMTTEFVSLPATMTAKQALEEIRKVGAGKATIYATYVTKPKTGELVCVLSLRQILIAPPEAKLDSIEKPRRKPITASPLEDRREVARLISKYDLLAIPVVDEANRMLGIVTVDDVIDAIVQENTEDIQRYGGSEALDAPYMEIGFISMIKKRAGWLAALFISEMLTASAMQHYQNELEKAVVLTMFIPLIMSSGGNSGSQATSLVIRALALKEISLGDWWRIARRELPAGLALGAILGVIGVVRITLWQRLGFFDYGPHWGLIAATVGAALIGIVTFGSLAGSMLPFVLKRLGFDPASASAPFVATLVDVTGLVIYFSVALLILRGTLL